MALTISTKTYSLDTFVNSNRVNYTGPAHSVSESDRVTLARTEPKATATSAGVSRQEFKISRTAKNAAGEVLGVIIFDVQAAIPVGTTATLIDAAVDDVASFYASASAEALHKAADINQ